MIIMEQYKDVVLIQILKYKMVIIHYKEHNYGNLFHIKKGV